MGSPTVNEIVEAMARALAGPIWAKLVDSKDPHTGRGYWRAEARRALVAILPLLEERFAGVASACAKERASTLRHLRDDGIEDHRMLWAELKRSEAKRIEERVRRLAAAMIEEASR